MLSPSNIDAARRPGSRRLLAVSICWCERPFSLQNSGEISFGANSGICGHMMHAPARAAWLLVSCPISFLSICSALRGRDAACVQPPTPFGKPAKSAPGKARTATMCARGRRSRGPTCGDATRWRDAGVRWFTAFLCTPTRSHSHGRPCSALPCAHMVRIRNAAWRRFSPGFWKGTNGTGH